MSPARTESESSFERDAPRALTGTLWRNSGVAEQETNALAPAHRSILVVDDDDPVRVMLARLLRTQGYTVVQASSARAARVAIEAALPDLVISDIVMPGESGIELRREIARRWPELPVILISGYSAEGPAEFSARTANTTFVQKPFAADQLLTLVQQVLEATPPRTT